MHVSIIGTGYVGLVTGTCFAEMGNDVICVDVDESKIQALKNGIISIYEPGLEEMVLRNYKRKTLDFMSDVGAALEKAEIVFIAVGTPTGEDGHADLRYVFQAAETIGKSMMHPLVVVNKSTVPVGTADKVRVRIQAELDKRGVCIYFDVVSNPEFLKEGSAVEDFMRQDRVVVGTDNVDSMKLMRELYTPFMKTNDRFIGMDIKSAEMTKYAANAMLATKISFINEIANICECVGADINMVRVGIGSDKRIGYNFIYPGCGYGGSCFPKDIRALIATAVENGYMPRILEAVEAVNTDQKKSISMKVVRRFGENLSGFVFALRGLSFKPDTDDLREASSLVVISELSKRGARIRAYDPKVTVDNGTDILKKFSSVECMNDQYSALTDADALILVTE